MSLDSIKKIKGGSSAILIIVTAAVMQAANWTVGHFLSSPEKIEASVTAVDNRVTQQAAIISTLCNDYGQTVSRMDQNIQNIGAALKVPVVVGRSNNDPCKQTK